MRDDDERLFRAMAAEIRRTPSASSDLDRRIMAEVRAAAREPRRRRWLAWLAAPRTVRLSPIAALAYAAGFIAVVLLGERAVHDVRRGSVAAIRPSIGAPMPDASVGEMIQAVRFVLMAPHANTVALVGDFNHWSPTATPLRPAGSNGVWIVDVPLPAGRHEYAFVIDGVQWVVDPAAPRAPTADFGTPNSVVTVTPEVS